MKTIAIVINTSWNVINFRSGLLLALQERGYKIVVIAPRDKYTNMFKTMNFDFYDIYINSKGTHPLEDLKLLFSMYSIYKKIKPDIILHYTIKPNVYGTIAASLLNIPTINNIAGLGTLFVNENFITSIAKKLYKYSQAKANYIFFQNNEDLSLFLNENLVDEIKTDVLPGSGIDINKFLPITKKDDGTIRFLLIARMLWEKGVGEYVEAAKIITAKYKNVEFQLLGFLDVENRSAISKDQMSTWVKDGHVNYLGITDNVQEYIGKVDCIILPSFYREGTPRTLLESASMGKPIITTDNVGCRDVVDDEINGFLCKIKSSKDLSEKIDKFLKLSKNEKLEMGKRSREKMIKEFDEKIVINKYISAIAKIS